MQRHNLKKAEAVRWLLTKGAQFSGDWPDTATLHLPNGHHLMTDERPTYIVTGDGTEGE